MIMTTNSSNTSTTSTACSSPMRKRQRPLHQETSGTTTYVHFNSAVKVVKVSYLVPLHADYDESAVQLSDIWYTSRDYKAMAKRDEELLIQSKRSTPPPNDSLLGLETSCAVRSHRRQRRNAGVYAVLLEQERQWEHVAHVTDGTMISSAYQKTSKEAQEEARIRAAKLASAEVVESLSRCAISSSTATTTRRKNTKKKSIDIDRPPPLSSSAGAGRWSATSSCCSPTRCGGNLLVMTGHRDSLLLLSQKKSTGNSLRLPVRSAC